jgi:hypothetical protein
MFNVSDLDFDVASMRANSDQLDAYKFLFCSFFFQELVTLMTKK